MSPTSLIVSAALTSERVGTDAAQGSVEISKFLFSFAVDSDMKTPCQQSSREQRAFMSSGELCARHYATRQPIQVRWRQGRITTLDPSASSASPHVWLAPLLVDLQVNGYSGIDFQKDDLTADQLLHAAGKIREAGCARFLLTLITDEWSRLAARFAHLGKLRDQSAALRSAIAGWHIEGPFLSEEPGYRGAHDPRYMIDPSPERIRALRDIAKSDPVLITLAPERPGAIAAIALAVSLGMKVSLGHTNASAEQLHQAVQAGATGFTHLGNGCPRELNRHDNILWRVFETPGLTTSLIPDQVHVSPALFRTVHRLLNSESICYTTDAMAAAGAGPGRYTIGHLNVEVGTDEVVRHPGQTNFAGSALRPIEGVFRAARMLQRPWQEVWKHASVLPARFMALAEENLEVGQPASFCVLEMGRDNQVTKLQVWLNGEQVL